MGSTVAAERSRWVTRVTWAALGAGVTAALMSVRGRGDEVEARPEPVVTAGGEAPREAAKGGEASSAVVEPTAELSPFGSTSGAPGLDPDPATESTTTAQSEATDELGESTAGPTHDSIEPLEPLEPSEPPEPPPGAAEPPELLEIPLPPMPGARVMSRGLRRDEEHGSWVLKLALSVPAPGPQAEAFYRSAMADAGLTVSGGSGQAGTLGSGHRVSLQGRSRDAIVQVNVQQRAGTLRSVVRIFWRIR